MIHAKCGRTEFGQPPLFDGQGLCLFSKRLDKGHFQWPVTDTGRVSLTPAQLSMLLEGIDWRMPARVRRPELAG
jgi:transposase